MCDELECSEPFSPQSWTIYLTARISGGVKGPSSPSELHGLLDGEIFMTLRTGFSTFSEGLLVRFIEQKPFATTASAAPSNLANARLCFEALCATRAISSSSLSSHKNCLACSSTTACFTSVTCCPRRYPCTFEHHRSRPRALSASLHQCTSFCRVKQAA